MKLGFNLECELRIVEKSRDMVLHTNNYVRGQSADKFFELIFKLANGDLTGLDDRKNNVKSGFQRALVFTNNGLEEEHLALPVAKLDVYETEREFVYEFKATNPLQVNKLNNKTGTYYLVKVDIMYVATELTWDNDNKVYTVNRTHEVMLYSANVENSTFAENISNLIDGAKYKKGIKITFDGVNNITFDYAIRFKVAKGMY